MRNRQSIVIAAWMFTGIAILVGIGFGWFHFFSPFAQRKADFERAMQPLLHLRPDTLLTGFGVFHVKFESDSLLTDENARELLSLNHFRDEYDVTLWIGTSAVTDESIDVLSQLKTTDAVILDRSGISDRGIARLASANPAMKIYSQNGSERLPRSIQGSDSEPPTKSP